MKCSTRTKWGPCQQRCDQRPCLYHAVAHEHPDAYYEQKIVSGVIQPAASYLSESQLHAVVGGRYKGDGRRIDAYVSWDVLEIDL